jgi:hypothetical protein
MGPAGTAREIEWGIRNRGWKGGRNEGRRKGRKEIRKE